MTTTQPARDLQGATVRTRGGLVQGFEVDGVHGFLGIPYAAPPVGALRFAAPAEPEPWDGARPAVSYGPTAPQPKVGGIVRQTVVEGDGYLHVNVFTPDPGSAGLPVFVWIHGGGFVIGSNAESWDQGANLARRGMVCVSINYRLGIDGFMQLEDAPPNRGVMDWLKALEWVQDNIAAFGGDPSRVTVGGYSAGSAAALVLQGSPATAGLLHQVIAMSGVPWNTAPPEASQSRAAELSARLGVPRTTVGIDSVERSALLDGQQTFAPMAGLGGFGDALELFHRMAALEDLLWLGPVPDGDLVAERPVQAVGEGAARDRPTLVGSTLEEMDPLMGLLGNMLDRAQAETALVGIGIAPGDVSEWFDHLEGRTPGQVLGAALTVLSFRLPVQRVAEARFAAPAPTWLYEVTWRPDTPIGAVHSFDLPYAFDNLDAEGVRLLSAGEPPAGLAADMSGAIERFVNGNGPGWAPYDEAARVTMAFGVPSEPRLDPGRTAREVFGRLR